MIQQLSIFAPNVKGSMVQITKLVSDAGIDIFNVVTNDSAEFGIVRMLVTEPQRAHDILTENGYMCNLNKVIGVKIPDDVGSLTKLLTDISNCNINIDYLYACITEIGKDAYIVMHVDDEAKASQVLEAAGIKMVSAADVAKA